MHDEPPATGHAPAAGRATAHVPVMAQRCLDLLAPALAPRADGAAPVLVDATLGLGGHTELALKTLPHARVIGIDRDRAALALASERLAPFGDRFAGVHAVYDEIDDVVAEHTTSGRVEGILFDLGVSSMQLDEAERGFAYSQDGPLDMRMDASTGRTAADVLATEPEGEIRRILQQYGEEKFAGRIAAAVVSRRSERPLQRTAELADLVRDAVPAAARRKGGNPSKRTFQALRIAVNAELDVLARAVPAALDVLGVTGRVVVMAYQSLEDRIVKRALTRGATSSAPPGLPVEPEHTRPWLRLLTHGAETPEPTELDANPRSASVRLRAAEVVRDHREV